MEGNMKFSILVPVYQVEKYIDECIQSVLNQTYTNWELILVDDGSKDKSGEICDRYAERDERIHAYHKENRGAMHSRLYGIAHATGDFCVFLDSDDWLKKNALEIINQAVQKYDCDCVIYGLERIVNGRVYGTTKQEEERLITDKRELYRKCFLGNYCGLSRKAVRRTALQKDAAAYEKFLHVRVGEDLLHSIEVLKNSRSVAFIDDRLYQYRLNPNSVIETINAKGKLDDLQVRYQVLQFLNKEQVFSEEDFAEYYAWDVLSFCTYLLILCTSKMRITNKVKLLHKARKLPLYRDHLSKSNQWRKYLRLKQKIYMGFFESNHYYILIAGSYAFKYFNRVHKKVGCMLGKPEKY